MFISPDFCSFDNFQVKIIHNTCAYDNIQSFVIYSLRKLGYKSSLIDKYVIDVKRNILIIII